MFCHVTPAGYGEIQLAKTLTECAGKANISRAGHFIAGKPRVLAHRCKVLIPELKKFRQTEDKIKEDFHSRWNVSNLQIL